MTSNPGQTSQPAEQIGYTRLQIPLPGSLRACIDVSIASAVLAALAAAFWFVQDRTPNELNGPVTPLAYRAVNAGIFAAIAFCLTQIAGGIAIVLDLLCRPRLRKYSRRPLAVVLVFTTLLSIAAVLLTWFA